MLESMHIPVKLGGYGSGAKNVDSPLARRLYSKQIQRVQASADQSGKSQQPRQHDGIAAAVFGFSWFNDFFEAFF